MNERSIVEAAARLRRLQEPHLVATVVNVRGSAYRRPGARMLLTQFRWIAGSVSGGCLEGDIANKGWWRTQGGEPVVVAYDSRLPADDDDVRAAFGLGCDGVVEVMLERAGMAGRIDPLALAAECTRAQRRAAVATVFRSALPCVRVGARVAVVAGCDPFGDGAIADDPLRRALAADASAAAASGSSSVRAYADGAVEAFVEAIVPRPRLFVLGTSHDAIPLVQLARSLGWDVSVCTVRPRVATRERFAMADEVIVGTPAELAARIQACDRAIAIVMNHDYELDREQLGMVAGTRARYIGVLGPRARTQRMLTELCLSLDDPRIHAPIGLPLGAETPQEIALAAVAEVQAVLTNAAIAGPYEVAGPLRDRVSLAPGTASTSPPAAPPLAVAV